MNDTSEDITTEIGGVASTAWWTAAARAREQLRPDPLFVDPHAAALAGDLGERILDRYGRPQPAFGDAGYLSLRTRWYDDVLEENAPRQAVLLGAGLDTRGHRLHWPAGSVLYELDAPEVLAHKAAGLQAAGAAARCEVRYVAGDLAEAWPDRLRGAGFDPTVATLWIGEGLLFYLTEDLAGRVLREAAALSAPGSRLAVDLIAADRVADPADGSGFAWRFGTDEPEAFLAQCGWTVDAVHGPEDLARRYGRWRGGPDPARRRTHLTTAHRGRAGRPR
ncbi:class I SAM-dependent methyltransferase [Streptomyces sp. NPDC059629]|uniref:class I SAM-dependent methyltransferase n=1 Tax=Streptomyces sp. NPDC059629 TaxID=3346889 RepID=UPI0036CA161C